MDRDLNTVYFVKMEEYGASSLPRASTMAYKELCPLMKSSEPDADEICNDTENAPSSTKEDKNMNDKTCPNHVGNNDDNAKNGASNSKKPIESGNGTQSECDAIKNGEHAEGVEALPATVDAIVSDEDKVLDSIVQAKGNPAFQEILTENRTISNMLE